VKEIEGKLPDPASLRQSAPCANCDRPVFFNMATRRKEPTIIACGFWCRYTIHNARRQEKIARLKHITCALCGKPFVPKQRISVTARRPARSG
jgi:hypothetical protein